MDIQAILVIREQLDIVDLLDTLVIQVQVDSLDLRDIQVIVDILDILDIQVQLDKLA